MCTGTRVPPADAPAFLDWLPSTNFTLASKPKTGDTIFIEVHSFPVLCLLCQLRGRRWQRYHLHCGLCLHWDLLQDLHLFLPVEWIIAFTFFLDFFPIYGAEGVVAWFFCTACGVHYSDGFVELLNCYEYCCSVRNAAEAVILEWLNEWINQESISV